MLAKIKKSIQRFLNFLLKIATSKRTWIMAIGFLLFYRMKTFPFELNTSEFIQLINSKTFVIKELKNLNNKLVLFTRSDNYDFICHYPVTNLDSFNSMLLRKGVDFDYLSGLKALMINPYNHVFSITFLLAACSSQVITEEVLKLRNYWNRKNVYAVPDEEIFKEFITSATIKNHIKVIVDQMKNPSKYEEKNIKLIKGCLLYGKPGTGKTLLARCLSKIEGITFINTCASEFVELYVGSGAKKVREIFNLGRENAPAIIFIDELESIGVSRSGDAQSYTHNIERYATLNQLLAEMDGVVNNDNLIVIAATNREDLLDSALIRPGRFDYKINLSLPDKEARLSIFKLYLNKFTYDQNDITDIVLDSFADRSVCLTGANIESIVNDAATTAFSHNRNDITRAYLTAAFDKNLEEFIKFKNYEVRNNNKY